MSNPVDFGRLRYAQCWEDADVLVKALEVGAGDRVLSIASGGDNTLSLLAQGPARVVAVDLSPAQLACLDLRVAAYRTLEHDELLALNGSVPSDQRLALYRRCRPRLRTASRRFWDARTPAVRDGIGGAGKFERYFEIFRRAVLPLVHPRKRVARLLAGGSRRERARFYRDEWDTLRWRAIFRLFFSRTVLGRLGRDPSFFEHVEGPVSARILERTRYALTELDPSQNPYVQWILTGRHPSALPHALRPENFVAIRDNLGRLEWSLDSVDSYARKARGRIDAFNLSDIFEYMSLDVYHANLRAILAKARGGARLAYWNMLAPRRRPAELGSRLRERTARAEALHRQDKAFFYSRFVLEEVA